MKIYITHVQQRHEPISGIMSDKDLNDTVYSQLNVIKAIEENPNAIVVSEALDTNYTSNDIEKIFSTQAANARKFFANGIPTLENMSTDQKIFLAKNGGDVTLFLLNKIPAIYRSIDNSISKIVFELSASGSEKLMIDFREDCLIKCIQEIKENMSNVLARDNDLDVLVVFGALHDLEYKIQSLSSKEIIYKGEINTLAAGGQEDMLLVRQLQKLGRKNLTTGKNNITQSSAISDSVRKAIEQGNLLEHLKIQGITLQEANALFKATKLNKNMSAEEFAYIINLQPESFKTFREVKGLAENLSADALISIGEISHDFAEIIIKNDPQIFDLTSIVIAGLACKYKDIAKFIVNDHSYELLLDKNALFKITEAYPDLVNKIKTSFSKLISKPEDVKHLEKLATLNVSIKQHHSVLYPNQSTHTDSKEDKAQQLGNDTNVNKKNHNQ